MILAVFDALIWLVFCIHPAPERASDAGPPTLLDMIQHLTSLACLHLGIRVTPATRQPPARTPGPLWLPALSLALTTKVNNDPKIDAKPSKYRMQVPAGTPSASCNCSGCTVRSPESLTPALRSDTGGSTEGSASESGCGSPAECSDGRDGHSSNDSDTSDSDDYDSIEERKSSASAGPSGCSHLPVDKYLMHYAADFCQPTGQILGGGASGSVDAVVIPMPDGSELPAARKSIVEGAEGAPSGAEALDREMTGLMVLKGCMSAVQVYGYKEDERANPPRREVLMEMCSGSVADELTAAYHDRELAGCTDTHMLLPERRVLRIMYTATHTAKVLHFHNIAHMDFKPANLFVRPNNSVCVGDLGLSTTVYEDGTLEQWGGTRGFEAPELLAGRGMADPTEEPGFGSAASMAPITTAVDLHAIGATALSCAVCGNYTDDLEGYLSKAVPMPEYVSERLRNLIFWLCAPDPRDRPTAAEALERMA